MNLREISQTEIEQRELSPDERDMLDAVMTQSVSLNSTEHVVVITDPPMQQIGELFARGALCKTRDVRLLIMPVTVEHGSEPPADVSLALAQADVGFLATTKSMSHTRARDDASTTGTRIVSMPSITYEIAMRTLRVDYQEIDRRCHAIAEILTRASTAHVTAPAGTNLLLDIAGRSGRPSSGVFTAPGAFGNLPGGESYVAPVEGKANGTLVIDASSMDPGAEAQKPDEPTIIEVRDGLAQTIEGTGAQALQDIFSEVGIGARNIAELGIGTNPETRLSGNILESEKVAGTAHVALGNSLHIGGTVDVPFHLDGVISHPTVIADGTVVIEDGRLAV